MLPVGNDLPAWRSGDFSPPNLPWVTVICTVYNQQDYVIQALQSVVNQTYPAVDVIVIDNGSTDQSADRIHDFLAAHPSIRFIRNPINLGLNRAFNQGLALAKGDYVIDLSADDVLLPNRIARQVLFFGQLPDSYGVVFSNADYIDARGRQTGIHYPVDRATGRALAVVPVGQVFGQVLSAYFICTPTMMMRRSLLHQLGGYDEALSYEDFDFWVRSSRLCRYAYLDEVLTQKRQLPDSLSAQVSQPNNTLLPSTLLVCRKAFALCETPDEFRALARRLPLFIRKSFYAGQFDLARQFGNLLRQFDHPDLLTSVVLVMCRLRVPVNRLYRGYLYGRNVCRPAKLV